MEFWLSRFVVEARKQDGSEYPAKSLYYLVCGLLRLLRNKEIYSMNFLDEKDIRFANFRKVLDSRMKELVHTGVGTTDNKLKLFFQSTRKNCGKPKYWVIIPQNRCSTLSIITCARSLDYVPATNTGVWNVPSSRLEKMMVTKNTFALSDEVTKHTRVVLRKFN